MISLRIIYMSHWALIIVLIILIAMWYWNFQLRDPGYAEIPLAEYVPKTGDLILFKAYDNWNGAKIGCYFGHIGVVYVDGSDESYIFEAAGTRDVDSRIGLNRSGILFNKFDIRVRTYKGAVFVKKLNVINQVISPSQGGLYTDRFLNFVDYALQNMYYEYDVVGTGLRKGLGIDGFSNGTNCGEIAFLSLVALGILPEEEYDRCRPHYLRDMCYIENCKTGWEYDEPVKLITDPFSNESFYD